MMKLRNKRTGEMGIINYFDNQSLVIYPIDENWNAKGDKKYVYHSLTELNEEWCDYEEPKEYWFIDFNGEVKEFEVLGFEWQGWMKEIGNYFETEEEAEKAVEKLKAWKRLRDKGFRFNGWECTGSISFTFDNYCGDGQPRSASDYLDLLFGGEE